VPVQVRPPAPIAAEVARLTFFHSSCVNTLNDASLEKMADTLIASGEYRVLRRLKPRAAVTASPNVKPKIALFVDVETTGLDQEKDEIIELAMVPFTYGPDGQIYEVREPFQLFHQPKSPISAEITNLTGITNEMVAGHALAPDQVAAFAKDAVLIIAHNAGFDRRFLERLSETFVLKPWACSQSQIDWKSEGFEGTRLSYLAAGAGFFYDKHRAANDCLAAVELLATPLPVSGAPAMAQLLDRARTPSWRIWAENSPFDLKDILKARGYRWNGDGTPFPKAWYVDIEDAAKDAEIEFLKRDIYQRDVELLVRRVDAYNRFSGRY
jgi:DNA polymerase III subunit epsilon